MFPKRAPGDRERKWELHAHVSINLADGQRGSAELEYLMEQFHNVPLAAFPGVQPQLLYVRFAQWVLGRLVPSFSKHPEYSCRVRRTVDTTAMASGKSAIKDNNSDQRNAIRIFYRTTYDDIRCERSPALLSSPVLEAAGK